MDNQQKFWSEFIEIYRQRKYFWDVKGKEYLNMYKQNKNNKTLFLDFLKKKINSMRTAFKR